MNLRRNEECAEIERSTPAKDAYLSRSGDSVQEQHTTMSLQYGRMVHPDSYGDMQNASIV